MKDFVVLFDGERTKIVKGDLSVYKDNPSALFNPSLERVRTTPPHLWVRVGDQIYPPAAIPGVLPSFYIRHKLLVLIVTSFLLGVACSSIFFLK